MVPRSVTLRINRISFMVGPLATLAVSPFWSYDPINPIKVLVISVLTFAAAGLLIPYLRSIAQSLGSFFNFLVVFFVLALVMPLIFSDGQIETQIWGQFGRSTGFLAYLTLVTLLYVVASLQSIESYSGILTMLIITSLAMSVYALLQFANLDPITWSAQGIFGTLGNVNFFSGFMGTSLVACFVIATSGKDLLVKNRTRVLLSIHVIIGLWLVAETDSIQGIIAFSAGISVYALARSAKLGRIYFVPFLSFFLLGVTAVVSALFNRGPISSLIYQVTISFRADYMHAAIEMMKKSPFFGVGLDSYDDWYRAERGVISAFRTSFNRTANTAHNIALDLGSGGGFPLFIAYVILMAFVLVKSITTLRQSPKVDYVFIAIFSSWVAYQVQSAVSINQIGVGVWGWILSGSVVGYSRIALKQQQPVFRLSPIFQLNQNVGKSFAVSKEKTKSKNSKDGPNTPPPLPVAISAVFLMVGFSIAFLPFKTDVDFRSAYSSGQLLDMMEIIKRPGSNPFLIAQAQAAAVGSNFNDQGRILNEYLTQKYPRYAYGWITRTQLPFFSDSERQLAIRRITELDPYFALCWDEAPAEKMIRVLNQLPASKQLELAESWGLNVATNKYSTNMHSFKLLDLNENQLKARLMQFCN